MTVQPAVIGATYAFLLGVLIGALLIGFILEGKERVLYGKPRSRGRRRPQRS